ncbi:hypothetical protein FACS1894211_02070 [Clostridia bacterium]|nr:hypothetical protein FACS1894211_02070 [Clostridia bacterium]
MKVKYTFATKETVEVEVNDELAQEIKELDRKEYNSNKKETRRHCSADAHFEKFGFEIIDETDFVEKLLSKELWHRLLRPLNNRKHRHKGIRIYFARQRHTRKFYRTQKSTLSLFGAIFHKSKGVLV